MVCACVIISGTFFFLLESTKQQREMAKFKFYGVHGTRDGEFLILCLNLNAIRTNNVPR